MRKIVKECEKIEELNYQFTSIDCVDWLEVDKYYPDKYLIDEAKYKIGICNEWLNELYGDEDEYSYYQKSKRQLNKFINKWSKKCTPHVNDGLSYEKIEELIIKERK